MGGKKITDYTIGKIPLLFSDRLIITTNFDRAIENAFANTKTHLERITPIQLETQSQKLKDSIAKSKSILFKMHGDYEDKEGIVFDKSSYDNYYGIMDDGKITPLVAQLSNVLENKHLLFLGASLLNDRTMEVIRNIVSKSKDSLWHYAIIEGDIDNKNALNERARELTTLRIHPIFYPKGKHESIDILLDSLKADTNI